MPDWGEDEDEAAVPLACQRAWACACDGLPKPRATTRRRRWEGHSGHILLPLPQAPSILLRQFCAVVAVLPPAFKRIDIAESAGVNKVELDDIIAVVELCAWVWLKRSARRAGEVPTRGVVMAGAEAEAAIQLL